MLRLDGVTHSYSLPGGATLDALRGISLTIAQGERVAIVGANGSGKSTLARHLNGLLLPTQGDVYVNGINTRNTSQLQKIRQTVGIVFQDPDNQLVATVVEEDVAFGPENFGVPYPELQNRVTQALGAVDLIEERQRSPHLLSGGQRQRVAIAGILAMRPQVLVLDEATAMLDPRGRRDVLDILARLQQEGVTIVQVTHFMHEAALADRVIVLDTGEVVADGAPARVFEDRERLLALGLEVPAPARLSLAARSVLPGLPIALTPDEFAANVAVHLPATLPLLPLGEGWGERRYSTGGPRDSRPSPLPAGERTGTSALDSDIRKRPEGRALLEVRGLEHVYLKGTPLAATALRGVDFDVREGEILGVVGATGSGKSTLLQHLNGLLRPQAGRVRVLDLDLANPKTDIREARRMVGLVFQNPEDGLFEQYVGDDIAFGPRNLGLDRAAVRERVREAMSLVGLDFEGFKDRLTFSLSGGQRRRVALAGVLALKPKVLVLDEPTAGLDPGARAALLKQLTRLRRETGLTIVIATHSMDDLAEIADRITILAQGRVVLTGTPREVFGQPERLAEHHLGLPQAAEIAAALRRRGCAIPADILTVEEAEQALMPLLAPTPMPEAV
ncbi:MAG: energy-coupling factor transporter ATPase [Anaerolineae bacterium]